MLFGKSAKTGNEIDMYVGQCKTKIESAIMTLNQSDMVEMQFDQLIALAKQSGDPQMVSQFSMLKNTIDMMQKQTTTMLNNAIDDLKLIDKATDRIQGGM